MSNCESEKAPGGHRCAHLTLRVASVADAAQLYRWDEQPHVRKAVSVSGEHSFDADWEKELAEQSEFSSFYIAEIKGQPIGALQITDPAQEPTHYWGAISTTRRAIDIWIGEPSQLGKGYGSQMMTFAIEKCFAEPSVAAVLIDPLINNTASHRFYKRLGFRFLLRQQFGVESDCFIFILTRQRWGSKCSAVTEANSQSP